MAPRRTMDKRAAPTPRTKIHTPLGYDPSNGGTDRIENFGTVRKRGRPRKASYMDEEEEDEEEEEEEEEDDYSEPDDEEGVDSAEAEEEPAAKDGDPAGYADEDKDSTIIVARLDGSTAHRQTESKQSTEYIMDVQKANRKKLVVRRSVRAVSTSTKESTRRVQRARTSDPSLQQNSNQPKIVMAMATATGTRKRMRKGKPCRAAEACLSVAAENP